MNHKIFDGNDALLVRKTVEATTSLTQGGAMRRKEVVFNKDEEEMTFYYDSKQGLMKEEEVQGRGERYFNDV